MFELKKFIRHGIGAGSSFFILFVYFFEGVLCGSTILIYMIIFSLSKNESSSLLSVVLLRKHSGNCTERVLRTFITNYR